MAPEAESIATLSLCQLILPLNRNRTPHAHLNRSHVKNPSVSLLLSITDSATDCLVLLKDRFGKSDVASSQSISLVDAVIFLGAKTTWNASLSIHRGSKSPINHLATARYGEFAIGRMGPMGHHTCEFSTNRIEWERINLWVSIVRMVRCLSAHLAETSLTYL